MADTEEQEHTKLDPRDIYEKPAIYKEDPDLEVPYPLLCGEHVIRMGKTADAVMVLSKYRFFVKYKKSFTNIPVRLIEQLEASENFLVIRCKDGKTSRVKFASDEQCQEWFHILEGASSPPTIMTDFFAFCFHAWCFSENGDGKKAPGMDFLKPDNLFEYNFSKEVQRLGFNIGNGWKVYRNVDFKVSSTYPEQHIVPAVMDDDEIRKICKFRSKGRFPSVVWRHPRNGAVIVRCGQPEVGVFNWRCKEDEKLIDSLLQACSTDCHDRQGRTYMNGHAGSSDKENNLHQAVTSLAPSKRVLIVDLRSYASAYANKLKGGGYEYEEYYETSETIFMGLVNIHSIRKSFQSLRTICSSATESSSWLSKLESSEWLLHLSLLLKTAHVVVKCVHKDGRPAVIHCTDGWDRTTQIVGLAEIMLDPYYRTLEGIQVLIEREWLDFGHQFATRCGHDINENDLNGRSPVFLQWLDCLHQLLKQFPTAFEFNETFLVKLAKHVYSCLFGTFLCNTKRERLEMVVQENTCSVWAILQVEPLVYKNFLYHPNNDQVLHPAWNISDLQFWSKLYLTDGWRSEVEDGPTTSLGESASIGSPKLPRTKSVDDIHKTASEEDGRRGSFVETSSLARTSSDPNLSDVRLEELVGTPPKGNYMLSSLSLEPEKAKENNASSQEEQERLLCRSEKTSNSAVKVDSLVSSEPKEIPQVEYSLMQSVEQQQVTHELLMQSSTDTVTEETPRNAPSFGLCNGYHSEELSVADHKDSNHNSENHLKLIRSSSVSTSTSDISNSHVTVVNGRRRKRSFDILTDMGKHPQSRIIRGSQSDSETRSYSRDSELAEISSSLLRGRNFSGPRSPTGTNCSLQIGRHLDEDGLTIVADPDQKRLVEIMLQLEAEKESMRRRIADLQTQLNELQCHDNWHEYQGLRYRTANCEGPKSLTVEEEEIKPSSVPNSLHSDTSWDQLDDREANQTLWVPDHAVTQCECGTKFGLIHRKHHCRNCGKIFCSSCSNFFIAIPREQLYEPQRVCMTCHRSLQEQQPQSSRLCSSQTSLDEGGNLLKVVTVVGQG